MLYLACNLLLFLILNNNWLRPVAINSNSAFVIERHVSYTLRC